MKEKEQERGNGTEGFADDSPSLTIPLCATNPPTCQTLRRHCSPSKLTCLHGSPILADPRLVQKAASALTKSTMHRCNQACLDFTFKGMRLSCLVNPTAGTSGIARGARPGRCQAKHCRGWCSPAG